MTLCDAGPLIAIIDADETDHSACLDAMNDLAFAVGHDVASVHRSDVPARPSLAASPVKAPSGDWCIPAACSLLSCPPQRSSDLRS